MLIVIWIAIPDEVNVDYDIKEDGDDILDNKVEVHDIDEGLNGNVDTVHILNNMA